MCSLEDPLFTSLLPLARVPFKQKSQFTRPPLRKFGNFSLNSLNFCPNFSSQAPKFENFQLTSPQIWKFSAHKPPFSEAYVSSQAPHFGNSGRTPLPEKKLSAPPGLRYSFPLRGYCTPNLKLAYFVCYPKITIFFFFLNNICFLKQIVQGTQKWH